MTGKKKKKTKGERERERVGQKATGGGVARREAPRDRWWWRWRSGRSASAAGFSFFSLVCTAVEEGVGGVAAAVALVLVRRGWLRRTGAAALPLPVSSRVSCFLLGLRIGRGLLHAGRVGIRAAI